MAERSFWWTTGGVGDGEFEYTRDDWQQYVKIQAACHGEEGIAAGGLAATGATNQVTIGPGMAIVDGKPYINDDNVVIAIPSAVGGGNTRIDRIVLRANWDDIDVDEGQRVRLHLIPGTDAGSPSAPAVASTSQDLYDVKGWQVLVDTDGAITLTDERELAVVEQGELGDAAVMTANIAAEAVTRDQAGVGLAYIDHWRGGHITQWPTAGTTNYDVDRVRMIGGAHAVSSDAGSAKTVTVLFQTGGGAYFGGFPGVYAIIYDTNVTPLGVTVIAVTAESVQLRVWHRDTGGSIPDCTVLWLAVGPAP